MWEWILWFVGLACLYAAIGTALILGLAHLSGWRRAGTAAPLVFLVLVFVALTQHPFPAPGTLVCPATAGAPQLQPFQFADTVAQLLDTGAGPLAWVNDRLLLSTTMNFVLCALIGAALTRVTLAPWVALVLAPALTLAVELTQLTGIWGLYPCAYRQFNVDDLIMNGAGLLAGFLVGYAVAMRRRRVV